ncbi:zinc-binding dehydrogenase [Kribbella sp. NPDC050470]|uniref:zinc-dependent alcohol dehydrogenase n=1 Tax=unclassified Kribbella TaxID=2644121 RepID=UPI0037895E61
MRAAVLEEPRRVVVADVPDPAPADGVLLRMHAVGLCGSDLHTWRGHHPFRKPPVVLGHEGAGEVVASSDPGFRVGDRVAVLPALSCWECARCEAGHPHLCAGKRVPGGGWPGMLSEYFAAPGRVLVPLADEVGYDEGALIEPLAVAWHCTWGVEAGSSVAVLGGGPIGSLVAAVSRIRGASTVLVTDVKAYNREFLVQQGVPHVVDPSAVDLTGGHFSAAAVGADPAGDGFDVVVVASGHPSCLAEAFALCRPRGRVVLLPMFAGPLSVDLNPVVLKEVTVQGSTIYTPADFRHAARLINDRVLDVRPYITSSVPLAETPEVLTAMDAGIDHLKIQIEPTR